MKTIKRPSPHGGGKQAPEMIIIHAMGHQIRAGENDHPYAATFLERIGLSAHRLGAPDGTVIICRDDDQVAWHARGHNLNSLGYEALVPGIHDIQTLKEATAVEGWLPEIAYQSLLETVRTWMVQWNIPADRVVRHSDLDPERRWFDPGEGFPWERLKADIS